MALGGPEEGECPIIRAQGYRGEVGFPLIDIRSQIAAQNISRVALQLFLVYASCMFGFPKPTTAPSPPSRALAQAVLQANNVACDFSGKIVELGITPGLVYDEKLLTLPKAYIKDCCKVWIRFCTDAEQRNGWMVIYPMLAQFQKGVGTKPAGLDVTKINMSAPDAHKQILAMTSGPSQAFVDMAEKEGKELSSWVTQALTQAPPIDLSNLLEAKV